MKKLIIILALASVGCGHKITFATISGCNVQETKNPCIAYQIVNILGLFQDAAIGANNQNLLSEADTKEIVLFVKNSVTIVQNAPNGWRVMTTVGLRQLKISLSPNALNKYQLYINLLEALINNGS